MQCSREVDEMIYVAKGPKHGPAPIPEEGLWVKAKQITDISGLTHGVGWCAPQQGACKLTLNVKEGIIEEALVETIGCSGMTHSAAMAAEILSGKTLLEALNTDLVCDAINTAMRELFLQIAYGRTQTAFSECGLPIGAGLEDLGKGLRCTARRPRACATSRWPKAMCWSWRFPTRTRSSATSSSTSAR
jgi:NifU-like protein involved in Fe-S cluster formation